MMSISDRSRRLTAVIGFLLLAACSGGPSEIEDVEQQAFDDLREEVRLAIDDTEREAAVIDIVNQLQTEFGNLRELAESRRKRLRALNADYDATREAFAELLADFEAEREVSHSRFIELRESLETNATPEEWAMLEKTNTKAMAQLAAAIAAI